MDGDLLDRITGLLTGYPLKESIAARRRGGVAVRRWDKEVRIDVYRGFDPLPGDTLDVVDTTMKIAATLRAANYLIYVIDLDETHGALRTHTPPAERWSPR
jgi:hypothetical protein